MNQAVESPRVSPVIVKPPLPKIPPALRVLIHEVVERHLSAELTEAIVAEVCQIVAEHLQSRDTSLLAALQNISHQSGRLQQQIRERSGQP